jgi:hypothetical protein
VVECEDDPTPEGSPWLHMIYVVPERGDRMQQRPCSTVRSPRHEGASHSAAWLRVVEAQSRARRFSEREGWRLDETVPPASNGLFRLLHYRFDL